MVDKKYCMSSYMAFRYIAADGKEFYEGMHHANIQPIPRYERIPVYTAQDIDREITKEFATLRNKKLGICLSGGMDSAICASYMSGCDAYTFRFLGGDFQEEELQRAEYYATYYGLKLHYVDVNWEDTVEKYIDPVMEAKGAPVHSIEPQLLQLALQAKADDVEMLIVGESSDLIFGGMDQLISPKWTYEGFKKRYMFTDPAEVLVDPEDMNDVFEQYRLNAYDIDYMKFMDEIFAIESSSSYMNAFAVAGMPYFDPYAHLTMAEPLDLERVRNGEPKYLIRELMAHKYPEIPVPFKLPMPRPVDEYFKNWNGPIRPEFKKDLNMSRFTGNQKWQMWCLERFLNNHEKLNEMV